MYFNNILKKNSGDRAAHVYRERSARFLIEAPPPEWDGVEVMEAK